MVLRCRLILCSPPPFHTAIAPMSRTSLWIAALALCALLAALTVVATAPRGTELAALDAAEQQAAEEEAFFGLGLERDSSMSYSADTANDPADSPEAPETDLPPFVNPVGLITVPTNSNFTMLRNHSVAGGGTTGFWTFVTQGQRWGRSAAQRRGAEAVPSLVAQRSPVFCLFPPLLILAAVVCCSALCVRHPSALLPLSAFAVGTVPCTDMRAELTSGLNSCTDGLVSFWGLSNVNLDPNWMTAQFLYQFSTGNATGETSLSFCYFRSASAGAALCCCTIFFPSFRSRVLVCARRALMNQSNSSASE